MTGTKIVDGLSKKLHTIEILRDGKMYIDKIPRAINPDTLLKIKLELSKMQTEQK